MEFLVLMQLHINLSSSLSQRSRDPLHSQQAETDSSDQAFRAEHVVFSRVIICDDNHGKTNQFASKKSIMEEVNFRCSLFPMDNNEQSWKKSIFLGKQHRKSSSFFCSGNTGVVHAVSS